MPRICLKCSLCCHQSYVRSQDHKTTDNNRFSISHRKNLIFILYQKTLCLSLHEIKWLLFLPIWRPHVLHQKQKVWAIFGEEINLQITQLLIWNFLKFETLTLTLSTLGEKKIKLTDLTITMRSDETCSSRGKFPDPTS